MRTVKRGQLCFAAAAAGGNRFGTQPPAGNGPYTPFTGRSLCVTADQDDAAGARVRCSALRAGACQPGGEINTKSGCCAAPADSARTVARASADPQTATQKATLRQEVRPGGDGRVVTRERVRKLYSQARTVMRTQTILNARGIRLVTHPGVRSRVIYRKNVVTRPGETRTVTRQVTDSRVGHAASDDDRANDCRLDQDRHAAHHHHVKLPDRETYGEGQSVAGGVHFALASGRVAIARRRFRIGPEAENEVSGDDTTRVERVASAEPTLDELAQKLSELRQHLEQVVTGLNRATSGARIGDSRADENSVRCHACSRTGSTQQAGWTLRLCGDDELHPFCPDCDRRGVDGNGGNGAHVKPIPQGVHRLPALGEVSGW